MVCIAAFIILCIVGVFVAFISIFRRDIGRRYLKVFKQSLACVGKKARLQKCETGFKDNVKNGLMARIALKNPKLLKPASITIEIGAVLIVLITVWSLVESAKAGLALWTLGTCNVEHPASCALSSAEVCSIDGSDPESPLEYIGQWFSDWGEIFAAIPDKFRSWDAANFDFRGIPVPVPASATTEEPDSPAPAPTLAIDIMDPGCVVCATSFRNQLESGFFTTHSVVLVPYVIKDAGGPAKFKNSELIVRYLYALLDYGDPDTAYRIIHRIFTEKTSADLDYQSYFNYAASPVSARDTIEGWLREFGFRDIEINYLAELANSAEITALLDHHHDLVINHIHAKGIPTMLYDGAKHSGKFEPSNPA